MNTKTPLKLFSLLLAATVLAGCASRTKKVRTPTPAVAMGGNTYSITRQASTGLTRDTEKLAAEAREDAEQYCTDHGKKLKIISESEDRPYYTLGYSWAKVIFKALDATDPELTAAPAPLAAPVAAAGTAYPTYTSGSGDLYTELNKLDDLRKRGILTDKEFEAEKKKVLKHSH